MSLPSYVTVSLGTQVSAPNGNIPQGTNFQQGQWAASSDNAYVLVLQYDGNLVLYQAVALTGNSLSGYALWSTQTTTGALFCVETTGDLLVLWGADTPVWNSNTVGTPKYLSVQTDGNLVLYGLVSGGQQPLWATGTNFGLTQWLPTVGFNAVGRFDGMSSSGSWSNLNKDGNGNLGGTPTVVTLNETTLLISGGYFEDGQDGVVSIGITLTGAVTCEVQLSLSAPFWNNGSFTATGVWQIVNNDEYDYPGIAFYLDAPISPLILTSWKATLTWYPSLLLTYTGRVDWGVGFENMTMGRDSFDPDRRGAAPRPAPGSST